MADDDFTLLSRLKTRYPSVPITIVSRVLKKYNNDEERCRQELDTEEKRLHSSESDHFETIASSNNYNNNNNNLESPSEVNKYFPQSGKEFLKSEGSSSSQSKMFNMERHVTTIERSIGNTLRQQELKRPNMGQSVSWTVQSPDRPSHQPPSSAQPAWMSNNMPTPQTAPPDFSPFFKPTKEIPNINCTSGFGTGAVGQYGTRHHQTSGGAPAASNPGEQRRPVRVINISAGSSSGGSVSVASAQPVTHQFHRMHFGDTGGVCAIAAPPPSLQHYGSTPNISQFRSEIRTDASIAKPVHSSSIVVNTFNHTNNLTPERKLSAGSNGADPLITGRRTPNPPSSFSPGELQPNPVSSGYSSGKLSTPIQASSPGIGHSKPVFIEVKSVPGAQLHGGFNEPGYPPAFYPGGNIVRPPPTNLHYMSQQNSIFGSQGSLLNYHMQYHPDFPSTAAPVSHSQQDLMYSQNPPHDRHPGFSNPSSNFYHPTASSGYSPGPFLQQYSPPSSQIGYHVPAHTPTSGHVPPFSQYQTGHSPGMHLSKSSSVLGQISQLALSSRSNSQDSEHSTPAEFDSRHHPPYASMGSRDSSHSSLSSDSSSHMERVDAAVRSRSGSIQDDSEYIQVLVQNQKRQVQKLLQEINRHKNILESLRSEVSMMEKNNIESSHAHRNFPSIEDISQLYEKNRMLQTDIQLYMNEIEMYKSGQTPFNKMNPRDQQNFFENMPTGQQDSIYSRIPDGQRSPSPRPVPPPRPPPPLPARQRSNEHTQVSSGLSASDIFRVPPVPPSQPVINSGDSEEGEQWNCSACTFSNHPALKKCEMCEMPRIMPHLASSLSIPGTSTHQSRPTNRLVPNIGGAHHRSASPHSAVGHHHHPHSGT